MKSKLIIEGTQISKTAGRCDENNRELRGKKQENKKTQIGKTTEIPYMVTGILKEETWINCFRKNIWNMKEDIFPNIKEDFRLKQEAAHQREEKEKDNSKANSDIIISFYI